MGEIEEVLDRSIASEGYIIHEDPAGYNAKVDLSQIEVEKLKGLINAKLNKLVRLNKSRIDFAERFQKLIDEYNSGALNVELMFDKQQAVETVRKQAEILVDKWAVPEITKPLFGLAKVAKKRE